MVKCVILLIAALISVTYSQTGGLGGPRKICDDFLDIVFVFDGSSSVAPFMTAFKAGLINLLQQLDIDGATRTKKVQVGICYFGTRSQLVVPLTLSNNRARVISTVRSSQLPGGQSAPNEGLECAFQQTQRNGRSQAGKVIVTIIDGNPTTSALETATRVSADKLKSSGHTLVFIAVGDGFTNVNRLRPLASNPNLFFVAPTVSEFQVQTNTYIAGICPVSDLCGELLDIVFVVDGSSSVFPFLSDYRAGLVNLLERLDIDGATRTSKVQLGICYFGSGSQLIVPLTLSNNMNNVVNTVRSRQFPGGITETNKGLECAFQQIQQSGRAKAGKVIVTIMDGNPTTAALDAATRVSANKLKASGHIISIIAVGGGFTSLARIRSLASDPSLFNRVLTFSSFKLLTKNIIDDICIEILTCSGRRSNPLQLYRIGF